MQSLSFSPQSYAGKHPHYPRAMVTRRLFVSGLITAAVLGGILGAFLGYRITKKRNLSGECVVGHMSLLSFNDSNLTTLILNEINGVHIRDVLRYEKCHFIGRHF